MTVHIAFGAALGLSILGTVAFRLKKGKSPGVMNIILLISAILLAWFTVTVIQLFQEYGMIPDTLVSCVFMALAGEAGVMGWIKTNKEKYRDRRWQKEDQRQMEEAAKQAAVDPAKQAAVDPAKEEKNNL